MKEYGFLPLANLQQVDVNGAKKKRPRLQIQRPSAEHVSKTSLFCLSCFSSSEASWFSRLTGYDFSFGFLHFSFGEEEGGMPGQVSREDDDNKDKLLEQRNDRPLKGC